MRLIKIGLANINTTVGAFRANMDKVLEYARQMADEQCTVGAFQEQVISGYPAEDLVQWSHFVEEQGQELSRFALATKDWFPTVFTLGLTVSKGGHLYNVVAVICRGKILGYVPKEKLPTYGVFYERRTFSPGIPGKVSQFGLVPFGDLIFRFWFGTMAVEVCEDLWTPDGPMKRRAYSGAELVISASASPWRAGVVNTRREVISTRAADNLATLVYVNQVGGNDSLVFDGSGFVNQCGRMMFEAPQWSEGYTSRVVDLDRVKRMRNENTTWRADCQAYLENNDPVHAVDCDWEIPADDKPARSYPASPGEGFFIPSVGKTRTPREEYFEDLLSAMKMGLADYFEKTGVFERIGIALSGGKDSALTLYVAYLYAAEKLAYFFKSPEGRAEAMQNFVQCFSMPSRHNSEATKSIARRLCEALGVHFLEISIEEAVDSETAAAKQMLGSPPSLSKTVRQNIQARIRGERMWNWANGANALWLQTGNMSEKAVGYTTIGGDMMGGYSLIGNLPKTVVIELLRYLAEKLAGEELGLVLNDLLETRASAELEDDQEDERDLMPFPVLDACFALFAGEKLSPVELYLALRGKWIDDELRAMRPDYKPGMLKEWVKRFVLLFVRSIFKWVQSPQAVHLGTLDLDRERALQLPVVQSRQWLGLKALDKLPD